MKLLTILAITAVAFNINTTHAATCNNGNPITGANGHEYCLSEISSLNWWSAYTWCEAQGRHLATIYEACPDWAGGTGQNQCMNMPVKSYCTGSLAWSATANGSEAAFTVDTYSCRTVESKSRAQVWNALCY